MKYESIGDNGKTLSIEEYLRRIRPYLSNKINDLKTQSDWKNRLSMAINFMSSKDTNETRTSKSDDIEIMIV